MRDELVFDFTNLMSGSVGEHGVYDGRLASLSGKAQAIHADMSERRENGSFPYRDLHAQDVAPILAYTDKAKSSFDSFVNVGIGGSALGAQALVTALCHPYHNFLPQRAGNGMRMFFADNIDPDQCAGLFEVLSPEKTVFNVITKSGSTAETMGTFLVLREFLIKAVGDSWRDHVVVTTDVAKGDLRAIADTEGLATFVVPDGVGGRFSVLTPVGLLPAACAGIDIGALLIGAAAMDRRLESVSVMENPAYMFAMCHYLLDHEQGKRISVMMPYSSRLYGCADWYRQLWAESLGKKHDLAGDVVNVGPTPVKALGVTDQHSQVQLYVEGPYDKVFTILAVSGVNNPLPMKAAYPGTSSLDYLGGRTMAELMKAERDGTVYALTAHNRPNMTITFPSVAPEHVAAFMYAFEVAIVFTGGLYNINPLDQPGVEAGKKAAFALMGRPGYEERAAEIKRGLTRDDRYVK